MQNRLTRKGLSTIVASLLVLVFSITLAVSVALLVTDTVRASLAPATNCALLQLNPPITIDTLFYDGESSTLTLTLTRSLTAPAFNSLQFNIASSSQSAGWICADICGACTLPASGESQTYTFTDVPEGSSSLSISADGCILFSKSF